MREGSSNDKKEVVSQCRFNKGDKVLYVMPIYDPEHEKIVIAQCTIIRPNSEGYMLSIDNVLKDDTGNRVFEYIQKSKSSYYGSDKYLYSFAVSQNKACVNCLLNGLNCKDTNIKSLLRLCRQQKQEIESVNRIADKFKTVKDLVKAYRELEKAFTKARAEISKLKKHKKGE